MSTPLYTTEILRLAASLEEPRQLERVDGRAELSSPTCGSRIATAVQLDQRQRVGAIAQEVRACAFGQASAALVQKHAVGRDRSELADALMSLQRWLDLQGESVGWPGVEALAPARPRPGRHGAILLPFRALLAAVEAAK